MYQQKVIPVSVLRVYQDRVESRDDLLAVEEPLEIRLGFGPLDNRVERNLAVTMRTPGHDEELVLGFLLSEGIVRRAGDVLRIFHCEKVKSPEARGNVVRVELSPDFEWYEGAFQRNFYMTSSCGVCGKTSLEAVQAACPFPVQSNRFQPKPEIVFSLEDSLKKHQAVFAATGGLHAAALFSSSGELILVREDIGRHNALDKLIGAAAKREMIPLAHHIILLSGRLGFELVQKAVMAGAGALVALGAPSSLAQSLAQQYGLTLIGFLREGRYNQYI
ncbi:MAG: formate dehydrogenase accessory sulfurtransferase FdhD [Bacteroidia bacterium]|nr:formate dehydrogenase accessory sulfurtransferase FdhD [Bacteroidia bacterium]